ncbi:MAG: type III-A CRISPR-associated RAMP protein Csm3 [Anaerolineaceae bacterium]|nr:type III-A CRISPR-associated RAMP protein Csm3 [Anaerolineaceae bacterium]
MERKLLGKMIFAGQIVCVTGLHIGGSTSGIEIGGVENPVIKDPLTDRPFIPGSSLKGKLRSLSEWSLGLIEKHEKHGSYTAYDCHELKEDRPDPTSPSYKRWHNALVLGKLYGASSDDNKIRMAAGPSRLIVRDAFPTEDTLNVWETWLGTGIYTEIKTENTLDRITSEANPRPLERVPAGSTFDLSMVIDMYESEELDLLRLLFSSMRLLEQSSLGGSGSRGSGQISFEGIKLVWRPIEYYYTGSGEIPIPIQASKVADILPGLNQLTLNQLTSN